MADGGTIFLDEIGELPSPIQSKLLRVLQTKDFERVGENVTRKVDVRVISATNRNLDEALKEGIFREDLFYRLNVARIKIPALRERKEDIIYLVYSFSLFLSEQLFRLLDRKLRKKQRVMDLMQALLFLII